MGHNRPYTVLRNPPLSESSRSYPINWYLGFLVLASLTKHDVEVIHHQRRKRAWLRREGIVHHHRQWRIRDGWICRRAPGRRKDPEASRRQGRKQAVLEVPQRVCPQEIPGEIKDWRGQGTGEDVTYTSVLQH